MGNTLLLVPRLGLAQAHHEGILWPSGGVQVSMGQTPLLVAFSLQSRFHGKQLMPGVLVGTAQVQYRLPLADFSLACGYARGIIYQTGGVQMGQGYVLYHPDGKKHKPLLRLAYDYLWFRPKGESARALPDQHRVRLLAGAGPPLGKYYHLLLTVEPFLLRQGAWLSESRTQLGLRRKVTKRVTVDLLYFNRWQKPLTARGVHRWEHALNVHVQYALGALSFHFLHGR